MITQETRFEGIDDPMVDLLRFVAGADKGERCATRLMLLQLLEEEIVGNSAHPRRWQASRVARGVKEDVGTDCHLWLQV